MDMRAQATRLSDLTRAFYQRTHDSFSATRRNAWPGWDSLWSLVGDSLPMRTEGLRIADIACGNLRFVRFMQQKTKAPLTVFAFDECEPLLTEGLRALSEGSADSADDRGRVSVHGKTCDIASMLLSGHDFMNDASACDLTVAFGFMHHLPLTEQRERLLRTMVEHTAAGGYAAASFWQFADDARSLDKARAATLRAQEAGVVGDLASDDYLLGWQDDAEAFRFCHHFTESEIDALSASLVDAACEVARFSADGKSGEMNRYAVWRRDG